MFGLGNHQVRVQLVNHPIGMVNRSIGNFGGLSGRIQIHIEGRNYCGEVQVPGDRRPDGRAVDLPVYSAGHGGDQHDEPEAGESNAHLLKP